jgi:hypothetical protein
MHTDDVVALCAVVIVGGLVCGAVAVNENNRRRWRARQRRKRRCTSVFTPSPPPTQALSRLQSNDTSDEMKEEEVVTKRQRRDRLPVYSALVLRVKSLKPRRNKTYGRKQRTHEHPSYWTRVMLCKHRGKTLRFRRDFRGGWHRARDNNPWNPGDSAEWDPVYKTWCDRTQPLYSDTDGHWQTKSLRWRQRLHEF